MQNRLGIILTVCVLAQVFSGGLVAIAAPASDPASVEPGTVTGRVVNDSGSGIGGAYVFICDPNSGIPLSPDTYRPFTHRFGQPDELVLSYVRTDDDGRFAFQNLPAGIYRFVCQSWVDAGDIKGALEVNGTQIRLHGIAENVCVSPVSSPDIVLRPLGTGRLQIDADLPNNATLLVVSTHPTQADPILGFAGWIGGFLQHMIGGNRMPHGQTIIEGLPEGRIYYTMFAADNSPGFVDGQAAIKSNETTVLKGLRFVAGWSDGRHDPPAALQAVFEEVKPMVLSRDPFFMKLLEDYGLLNSASQKSMQAFLQTVAPNLDREVRMPSGQIVTFGQIVAAWKYVELQRMLERKAKRR